MTTDNRRALEEFNEYCKSLPDYKDIQAYLESDRTPFEPKIDLSPFTPDYSRAIIVDNIPSVEPEKIDRLKTVLLQIYNQFGEMLTGEDIEMPLDNSTRKTFGYCFIRFRSKDTAENAAKTTQNLQLDKKHQFKVNMYSDIYRYMDVPEEYQEPVQPPFRPRPDPSSWLTDTQCRDQFVCRYGHETEIQWANSNSDPELIYGGQREKESGRSWCESYVLWSPQGTYLATFHPQGIKLWGGQTFEPYGRFMHDNVEMVDFSPCENFMVTYRLDASREGNPEEAIVVWDIRNGIKLKAFKLRSPLDIKSQVQTTIQEKRAPTKPLAGSAAAAAGGTAAAVAKTVDKVIRGTVHAYNAEKGTFTIAEGNTLHENVAIDKVQPLQDPNRLKWSPDGRYAAKLGTDIIQVLETPSMQLLEKKSLAAKDVLEFVWAPRNNFLSYWAPGSGNHPALINIIEIPSRREVCSRKVFDVQDGRMSWQSEGDFLCVHMSKAQGKKKTYVLMFFRTSEENVPVELLELNDPVLHFSWEIGGNRFAVIHGEPRTPTVSFYTMGSTTGNNRGVNLLFSVTGKQYGEVIWSPAGGIAAIAQFASDACLFDLHDVDNNVCLASRRHDRGNRLTWDPSGRYIASSTIIPLRGSGLAARAISDDGFNIYTFQGTPVTQTRRERLYQFTWRPRPRDLISREEKQKVLKNLKKYERDFDREDRLKRHEIDRAVQEGRVRQASDFLALLSRRKAAIALLKQKRVELRDGYDSDDDRNYKVQIQLQETVVSTKETILN